MNNTEASIEVKNLTKRYAHVTAIRDVSFSVKEGEIVGFLGPNGAGKSTTMRILCGLITATSGSAQICGQSVAKHPDEVKRRIGYMPENNPLPEDMRVIEYLRYRGQLKEVPRKRLKKRLEEVLELCDLNRTARRQVIGTLSKGYRQRVGVADAILAAPSVIIMDEPTIGLDPHQILMIRDLIDTLRGKMTVILSSHILAEIELCCNRVIIINQGRVVATGTSESLCREFIKKTTYSVSIKGDLPQMGPLLRGIDPDLNWAPNSTPDKDGFQTLTLETPHTHNISEEILQQLHRQPNIRVRSFHRMEPNLEDIFLAATRHTWRETLSSQPKIPSKPAEAE